MSDLNVVAASERTRFGCKGPAAGAWLSSLGLDPPSSPNEWLQSPHGPLIARLGSSEFLIEASAGLQTTDRIARQLFDPLQRQRGLIAVPRQDHVIDLSGNGVSELLAQICSVDFRPAGRAATATRGPVILTMMMGVAATVAPRRAADGLVFTVWIDPSFATFFHDNLTKIVDDIHRDSARGAN